MSLLDKAEETVVGSTPTVIAALGRVKFLLLVVPIVSVVIGVLSMGITSERNIGTVVIKMGSFATPANPEPVMLASEKQVRARLRQYARDIKTDFPKSLMIGSIFDGEVITVTGTNKGDLATERYLLALVQREIDFQNGRLKKLQAVQSDRKQSLETALQELKDRKQSLANKLESNPDPVIVLALQQSLDSTTARISNINSELSTMSLLNASDLYIDTTQVVRSPFIVASSDWYRPLILGGIGLAIGLGLTLLIALFTIFRALSSKAKESKKKAKTKNTNSGSIEKD